MSNRFGTLLQCSLRILKKSPGSFVDNNSSSGFKKSWDPKNWLVLSMMMNHDSICGSKLQPENLEPVVQLGELLRDVGGRGIGEGSLPKNKWSKKQCFSLRNLKIQLEDCVWSTKMASGSSRYSFEPLHIFDRSKVPATTQKKGFNTAFPEEAAQLFVSV